MLLLAGLTGCVHYVAAPLDSGHLAASFNNRSLADPDLRRFFTAESVAPPDTGWSLPALALAAFYYHPALDSARAAWSAVRAAELTAGQRPQPGARADVTWASNPRPGESPWSVGLAAELSAELGGKRGARVGRARAATLRAELGLQEVAWQVGQAAQQAGLEVIASEQDLAGAEVEVAATREVESRLETRFAEGAISAADLAQARSDVQLAQSGAAAARRTRTEARARLAGTLGVLPRETASLPVLAGLGSRCESLGSLSEDSLRAGSLHQRYAVAIALAGYAESELSLRLTIARQYPDLRLGPGLIWDQGVLKWAIGFGLPAILLHRNRGPIAEAEARRTLAAAEVDAVQQQVSGEVGRAVAGCRAARQEVAAADSLFSAAARLSELARARFARGESTQADLALAGLAVARSSRALAAARSRWLLAGNALATALGAAAPGGRSPPDPRVSPRPSR